MQTPKYLYPRKSTRASLRTTKYIKLTHKTLNQTEKKREMCNKELYKNCLGLIKAKQNLKKKLNGTKRV